MLLTLLTEAGCNENVNMAMSKLLLENGIEPVMQISCSRNKIALQSTFLEQMLWNKNIMHYRWFSKSGDQQDAKAVHEFESVKLLRQIQDFNKGIDPSFRELADKKTLLFTGVKKNPNCRNQRSLKNRISKKKEVEQNFTNSNGYEKRTFERFCENIANLKYL